MSSQRTTTREHSVIHDPQVQRILGWTAVGLAVMALGFAGLQLLLETERTTFSTIATFAPAVVCAMVSFTAFHAAGREERARRAADGAVATTQATR